MNIMSPPLRLGMRPRQAFRVNSDHLGEGLLAAAKRQPELPHEEFGAHPGWTIDQT